MLDVIESSSMYIIDLYKREYLYVSPRFYHVFGFDIDQAYAEGPSFLDRRIHPDDIPLMYRTGNYFMKFALSLPPEKIKKGKLVVDYRIRNAREEYVRVIKQHIPLELDCRGNIWLVLCIIDLSPDSDLQSPFRARVIDSETGDVFLFNPYDYEPYKPLLSDREKEILRLIADGHASKQIADRLFISVNTVNTHRQRIIEKLNVSNTAEAVRYAIELGLLRQI
jgi:DNA-binding CsgD family transcriptional regulator